MIGRLVPALLACLLLSPRADAQQPIQPVDVPPDVVAALRSKEYILDLVRAWPVNWTPAQDMLVQATYAFRAAMRLRR